MSDAINTPINIINPGITGQRRWRRGTSESGGIRYNPIQKVILILGKNCKKLAANEENP
jgi:hypothetical protein